MNKRILADENVDRPIAAWLREQGHEVIEVASAAPGMTDAQVIEMSREQGLVLMTFDRDMGRIVVADRQPHPGVVHLRLRGVGEALYEASAYVWPTVEPLVAGHLVTVRNHHVRRRPLPAGDEG